MKRYARLVALAAGAAAAVSVAAYFGSSRRDLPGPADAATGATPVSVHVNADDTGRAITILSGGSVRQAVERLAEEFSRRHDVGVELVFGSSSQLLSAIREGGGDIYVCHDPHGDEALTEGLVERYIVAGLIEPIIIVPPENPLAITALADLAGPGLRIGLPDAKGSKAGEVTDAALSALGLTESVGANTVLHTPSRGEIVRALLAGGIDAGVVWSTVPPDNPYTMTAVRPADAEWQKVRVTVCLVEGAAGTEMAEAFLRLAESEFGRKVFAGSGIVVE